MVAAATMKEFCGNITQEFIEEFIYLPRDSGAEIIFQNNGLNSISVTVRYGDNRRYRNSTVFTVGYFDNVWSGLNESPKLYMQVSGSWNNVVPGIPYNCIYQDFSEFRTCKEAFETLVKKFTDIFQKPSSNGSVKVFYDTSEFIWCWKRPNSLSIIEHEGKYYYAATCDGFHKVNISEGEFVYRRLTQDELSQIDTSMHSEITVCNGSYWLKSSLVPVYRNSLPFETIERYVTPSQAGRYEFVMVNNERRYVSLRRTSNVLLDTGIHGYSTRIEQLIPLDKLFLKGKADLYARRPSDETPFLGWELEACSNQSTVGREATAKTFKEHMPWLIMCKSDSSISPEGFETVSVPATLDFWKESNLSSALDSMRVSPYNMRSFNHSSCGFHVHVSRSALSVLDLQKMERFLHNPDNKQFITTVAGRSDNTYAKYNEKMFSDRKSLTSYATTANRLENVNIEGISYFNGYDNFKTYLSDSMRPILQMDEIRKLRTLAVVVYNYVGHDSLGQIVRSSPDVASLLEEHGRNLQSHTTSRNIVSWSSVFSSMKYGLKDYPEFYGEMTKQEVADFYKKLLLIVCKASPKFAETIEPYFADWDWSNITFPSRTLSTEDVSWKTGLLKSKAPVGRRFNKSACDVVKGPVGKAVNDRYDILNTRNTNTVEFRLFKGTMNPSSIMRYLEFVDALVRFVASTSASNDGLSHTKFIKWLMGDSFNVVRYEHLISFIVDNGFLERKEIRKRELVEVVSDDKITDIAKLKVVDPVGFNQGEPQPLGSFTTFEAQSPSPVMAAPNGYDPDFEPELTIDDDYEEDEYDDPDCDCDDCIAARNEWN